MRRLSARSYLLGLIAAAVMPVWVFAAYLLISFAIEKRNDFEKQAIQIANESAVRVDDELRKLANRLDGLARSSAMAEGDLERLRSDAKRLTNGTSQIVLLRDFDRRQLFNTQLELSPEIPPAVPITEGELGDLGAGRVRISDVYKSPVSGEFRIAVARAVRFGEQDLVLAVTVPTTSLRDALLPAVPADWVVGVGDRTGVYVTRSTRHEEVAGKPGVPDYIAKAVGPSGTFTATNQFGDVLLAGYVRSAYSGWLIAANIPLAVVAAPLWQSIYSVLSIAAFALFLSLLLAFVVGRKLTQETESLAAHAIALGEGREDVSPQTRVAEFAAVAEAFSAAKNMIHARTQELEAVLETAPVAVWFTYDPAGRQVVRNSYAAKLMGVPDDQRGRFGIPAAVVDTIAIKDGKLVGREDRPLTRAMRGELTDHEEYAYRLANGEERQLLTSARPISSEGGAIIGAVQVSLDISERKKGEEQRRLLAYELTHRVKNTLAIVQSLAQQTLRNSDSLEAASEALAARLRALGQAHDVLYRNDFEAGELREILETSVLSHVQADRVQIEGSAVSLSPKLVMAITLSMHELATNAVKYGALSTAAGKVRISWFVDEVLDARTLTISWIERGGPKVQEPGRKGFGSSLLERIAGAEGGTVRLRYAEQGLECELRYPIKA